MKALTLWQPWASLMAYGEKKVETRGWTTKYRGPIAIHSALAIPRWLGASRNSQQFHDAMMKIAYANGMFENGMPKGVILAVGDLVAIEPTDKVRADLSPQEVLFGNYDDGRYAWFFENMTRLPKPIPVKGDRMLWEWHTGQERPYERNTHLNNQVEREMATGHRIEPAPRLDQLDGDSD